MFASEVRRFRCPSVGVFGMREDPYPVGLAPLVGAGDLEAVVGRAIVDYHHLEIPVRLTESALDCSRQVRRVVVRRDADRHGGHYRGRPAYDRVTTGRS